jgi:hypothetical protein
MKKSTLWAMAVMIMALSFVAGSVSGQGFRKRSQLRSGDKTLSDVETSYQLMAQRANVYQTKIDELKQENQAILRELNLADSAATNSLTVTRLRADLVENDRLIKVYRQKSEVLQEEADMFLLSTAGKSQESLADLRHADPVRVAQADVIMATAEEIRANIHRQTPNQNAVAEENPANGRPVIYLGNEWYQTLTVEIEDPAGRKQSFEVLGNSRGEYEWEYNELIPGDYCIRFHGPRVDKRCFMPVGPMIKNSVGKKTYPLAATYVY